MAIVGTITAWMSSFLSLLWCFHHLQNLLEVRPLLLVMTALFTASSVALAADGIAPREFQNPDANLAAFWFLNDAMQTDEMDRQLRAMKQAGFHSVVFHPRFGLGGDWGKELDYYLSDDYFQKVKFGLDVCQDIGLKVILYDEYNWPSGNAGGRVLLGGRVGDRTVEANPEYIARHLAMEEADADGGQVFSRQVPAGELVAVLAVPVREDGSLHLSKPADVSASVANNELQWNAPLGKWRLMFFVARDTYPTGSPHQPDYMNPAATDKFISVTHDEYYRRFPEHFGTTITGIFLDEPGFGNNEISGRLPNTVPWTGGLPEYFQQQKGYDLIPSLPCVWYAADEQSLKARKDFWDAVSSRYMESFFGEIHAWCQAHKIESIGHVLEESFRFHRTFEGGDFFKTMRYLDQGGIDQIGMRHGMGENNPKMGSSATYLFGGSHTMSETFGAYGWGLTLDAMKELMNWHAASGIDHEIFHGAFYSLREQRKTDCPPDVFYHQIWKDQFHTFAEYAKRLMYLADRGRQVADIAILYPATAIMVEGGVSDFTPLFQMEEYLVTCATVLRTAQYDFNYVDELALAKNNELGVPVQVGPDGLAVGDHTYKVIILGAVPSMSGEAAKLLTAFYNAGGTVIAVGRLPTRVTDGERAALDAMLETVFGTTRPASEKPAAQSNKLGGRGVFIPIANMISGKELDMGLASSINPTTIGRGQTPNYSAAWIQALLQHVGHSAERDVEIGKSLNPALSFLHKRGDGKDWYLIVNAAPQVVEEAFTFACPGTPAVWEIESGKANAAPVFRQASNRTTVPLKLQPYGAVAVVFGSQSPKLAAPHLTACTGAEVLSSESSGQTLKVSLLAEHGGEVSLAATANGRAATQSVIQPDELTPVTVESEWRFTREGVKDPTMSRPLGSWTDTYPDFSGTGWYAQTVQVDGSWLKPGRKVYLDLGNVREMAQVRVNGKDAGSRLWRPYRLDITLLLKAGKNRVEIGVTNTLTNQFGFDRGMPGQQGPKACPPSGLLGPVRLVPARVLEIEFQPNQFVK